MQKRHSDQLWARLDQLYVSGSTFITWGELYHWYNMQRLTKGLWRDLKSRWEELLEEKSEDYFDPQVDESYGGILLFFSKKPSKLSEHVA